MLSILSFALLNVLLAYFSYVRGVIDAKYIMDIFVFQTLLEAPFLIIGNVIGGVLSKKQIINKLYVKGLFGFLVGLVAYILLSASVIDDSIEILLPFIYGIMFSLCTMVFFLGNKKDN